MSDSSSHTEAKLKAYTIKYWDIIDAIVFQEMIDDLTHRILQAICRHGEYIDY